MGSTQQVQPHYSPMREGGGMEVLADFVGGFTGGDYNLIWGVWSSPVNGGLLPLPGTDSDRNGR